MPTPPLGVPPRPDGTVRPARPRTLVTIEPDPLNAELPLDLLTEPPEDDALCYVRTHFGIPRVDPADWRLRVGGLVDEPATWTLDELRELPTRTVTMVLECAGNGRAFMSPRVPGTPWVLGAVSQITFTGTPLRELLDRSGCQATAREVTFTGVDRGEVAPGRVEPYARSLTVPDALADDVLLAWEQNGAPLAPEHGSPLRLVVPGWYGMASVKWLSDIELSEEPFRGYYQHERYVYVDETGTPDAAPVSRIRVRALITSPGDGASIEAGPVEVRGVAWSGDGEITLVEVSADGGTTWSPADLASGGREPGTPAGGREAGSNGAVSGAPWGLTAWTWSWHPASSGEYELLVRATDAGGNVQPLASRWNRHGYGNNVVQRVKVRVAD